MNIKKEHLATLWYENEEGEKYYPKYDDDEDPCEPKPGFIYQHARFPNVLNHTAHRQVLRDEVDSCNHPAEHVRKTYGWIDGVEGRECAVCHGTQIRRDGEPWPDDWDAKGSRELFRSGSSWQEDLVLAIANSGDYKLGEAIIIAATSCERCMNALAHRYGLPWGYAEGSKDWIKANTSCRFCCEEEYENQTDSTHLLRAMQKHPV